MKSPESKMDLQSDASQVTGLAASSDAARAAILMRIRQAQGRGKRVVAGELAQRDLLLRSHPRGPLPTLAVDQPGLVQRFIDCALALNTSVERVGSIAQVPEAVARYLRGLGLLGQMADKWQEGQAAAPLAPLGAVWPSLMHLDWAAAGMAMRAGAANDSDAIGVTGVFAAIAETGTLMMASGPQSPATTSLLPETHIAIVPAHRIVAHMEDGFALVRAELGELPRAINFISGPSRTGDIEQTIVLGAHGPYRVHVIVLEQ
jgi:L-lactate dehydrogenase complex protein LldG